MVNCHSIDDHSISVSIGQNNRSPGFLQPYGEEEIIPGSIRHALSRLTPLRHSIPLLRQETLGPFGLALLRRHPLHLFLDLFRPTSKTRDCRLQKAKINPPEI